MRPARRAGGATRAPARATASSAGAAAPASEWGVELLDLPAYLDRVGDTGALTPTVRTLRRLHRAHVAAICFENLDTQLGRDVELGLPQLQDKLVYRRRGGYCHEQNLLFAAVLERLGFRVTRLLARPHLPGRAVLPRAHAALLVRTRAWTWLADVGYGGEGPLEPLALIADASVRQGGWDYRLRRTGREWFVQTRRVADWVDLYSFTRTEYRFADFAMASYHASTHPSSPFATGVVVQRNTDDARYALRGTELVVSHPDGTSSRSPVGPGELPEILRVTFGLGLGRDDEGRLLAALRRAAGKHPPVDR